MRLLLLVLVVCASASAGEEDAGVFARHGHLSSRLATHGDTALQRDGKQLTEVQVEGNKPLRDESEVVVRENHAQPEATTNRLQRQTNPRHSRSRRRKLEDGPGDNPAPSEPADAQPAPAPSVAENTPTVVNEPTAETPTVAETPVAQPTTANEDVPTVDDTPVAQPAAQPAVPAEPSTPTTDSSPVVAPTAPVVSPTVPKETPAPTVPAADPPTAIPTDKPTHSPTQRPTIQAVSNPTAKPTEKEEPPVATPVVAPTATDVKPVAAPTTSHHVVTPTWSDDNDEAMGAGGGVSLLLLLILIGVVVYMRVRRKGAPAFAPGGGNAGAYRGLSTNDEDDDDDWGWGDEASGHNSGRDVEMAPSTMKKHEDPPQPPSRPGLSLSSARPKTPPYQKKRLTQRGSGSRERSVFGGSNTSSPPSSPTRSPPSSAKPTLPAPTITKLASPKRSAPAPAPPKPKQDDIFAEMGFSAKPTFTKGPAPAATSTAARPSVFPTPTTFSGGIGGGGASKWQSNTTKSAVRSAPQTAPLPTSNFGATTNTRPTTITSLGDDDDLLGGDEDWGDDADLDDLLND